MANYATATAAMSSPPLSFSSFSSSPTVRFLGHLKVPEQPSDLEFQESDVVWSSSSDLSSNPSPSSHASSSPPIHLRQRRSGLHAALTDDQSPLVRRKSTMSPSLAVRTVPCSFKYNQSAPVNVPIWPKKLNSNLGHLDDVAEDGEIIPPHEIVARSYLTFSVFEGAGRTLKGRDLRRVRTAVFQQTGFLD